jgi:hypothetical protein
MTGEQLISLYLRLTNDIHAYWTAFGALTVLILDGSRNHRKDVRTSFGAISIGALVPIWTNVAWQPADEDCRGRATSD